MTKWAEQLNTIPSPILADTQVAVVGAGIGGLTTAYLLSKRGFKVKVYEAAERVGGRIYTDYDTFNPMFCEKGGEWIDSTHHHIIDMAHELGLQVQDISKKRGQGQDAYYFGGAYYGNDAFWNPAAQTGAYAALAAYIAEDAKKAKRSASHAQMIDQMSIDEYLSHAQKITHTPAWVVDAIRMAYKGEFGAETSQQSAMLMVNQIGVSKKRGFEVYGEKQDESHRIRGGNGKLVEALKAELEKRGVPILTGHALQEVEFLPMAPRPVYLSFTHGEAVKREGFDYVVSAIPFSKLRDVQGLDKLAKAGVMAPQKLRAIKQLPYGNIAKVILGLKGKPWRDCPHMGMLVNGSFRSDLPYLQNTWVSSYAQNSEDGLITLLVAGDEAKASIGTIVKGCKASLSQLLAKPEEELFTGVQSFHKWQEHQFSKGSYSYYKPGQYMTLRPLIGLPELRGRMGFVGEHTDPELYGFMDGAVHSGLNEAIRIEQDRLRTVAGSFSARAEEEAPGKGAKRA